MTEHQRAHINCALLIWAREQSRLSLEAAAKKIGVTPERLRSWEAGRAEPTVVQLRKAAGVYHFRLAIFYLPDPPRQYQAIRDYRRLFGNEAREISPELMLELRRAHDRREVVLELSQQLDEEVRPVNFRASLSEDPELVASQMRTYLSVSIDAQLRWRDMRVALNEWRAALERVGVLVFQAKGIELDEMRGFSIGDKLAPVIVINRSDAPAGRIFTMLHELTHIVLHRAGLCDLRDSTAQQRTVVRLEAFCNHVAGAALVPSSELLSHGGVQSHDDKRWSLQELAPLAREFSVSREVMIRRLLILTKTDKISHDLVIRELQAEYKRLKPRKPGFISPPVDALSLAGRAYSRLAVNAYRENQITASTLADLLGLRVKHLQSLEQSVVT